jgi:hypothetical protein
MSDSQEVYAALKRTIQTRAISEADKVILDPIIERTKSMEYDKLDEESKTQIISDVNQILTENGVTITTNDNGEIIFELPDKSIITHNTKTGERTTTQSTQMVTAGPTVAAVPKGFGSSSKRFGGNRTKKNGKKSIIRGGNNDNPNKELSIAYIVFIIVDGIGSVGNFLKKLYDDYQKKNRKPQMGDTYIANVKYTQESKPTIEYPLDYEEGDEISINSVPITFGEGEGKNKIVSAYKAVKNAEGETTFKKLYGLVNLENFHKKVEPKKVEPIDGGSKNRKSRSKTRKQKRRKTKK